MINRRYRRCSSMNNCQCHNQDVLETACNNVCSPTQNFNDNCSCGFDEVETVDVFPSDPKLGQSYVPFQYIDETYKPCNGLDNGTIFPELVSTYAPGDSMRDIDFIERTNTIGEGCNSCQ